MVNLNDIPNLAGVKEVIVAQRKWRKNVGDFPKKSVPGSIPLSHLGLTSKTPRIRSDSSYSLQGFHLTLDLRDLNFKGIIFG